MRVLVSAGDASGDLHSAEFVRALRELQPDLRISGLGGTAMEKTGVALVVHQREMAVGGLVEVISSSRRIVGAWRRLNRELVTERPDLVVLVDSPDFNIPFARRAKRAGVPVFYYVSPQVWAWRRGRIRKIARRVDRMATIFPFEPDFYANTGLRVDFVGHPLVEPMADIRERLSREQARRDLDLTGEGPVVVLLPGSRRNELRYTLALFLDSARELARREPGTRFVLALASTVDRASVEAQIALQSLPAEFPLRIVEGRTYEAVRAADVALAKPGTVTVEVALLECPLVVAGRAHPLTAGIMRRLVKVASFTMPNLILERPAIPEFLQEEAQAGIVADALQALLRGPARDGLIDDLREMRRRLGQGGAAQKAAAIADEMLRGATAQ